MRRLFGTIGLTYLTVLTAAFYCPQPAVRPGLAVLGAVTGGTGVVLLCKRHRYGRSVLVSGVTVLLAVLSIFLYQNYHYQPVVRDYSDKEISFRGYIADEILLTDKTAQISLVTEEVDGKPAALRIRLTLYGDCAANAFDVVEGRLRARAHDNDLLISQGCYLSAEQDDAFSMTPTGERHATPYQAAVAARKAIRQRLDKLLSKDAAALCKAILLGDKYAMSAEAKHDFQRTGTSFLIVVSGIHLSVICGFLLFLLRGARVPRLPSFVLLVTAVILFAALSGFTPSVIRSGVMMTIAYGSGLLRRRHDSLNALGIAALALSAFNPLIVANIGAIMSFTTTMGIVLWAPAIITRCSAWLRVGSVRFRPLRWLIRFVINLVAVSFSAAIWITPVTAIFFGYITPLVIPLSLLTSPLACVILIGVLLLLLSSLVPFFGVLTGAMAFALNLLCDLHLRVNAFFAAIPCAKVSSDTPALIIWIAVTCLLVAIGYLIRAKRRYILTAAALSLALLVGGVTIGMLTAPRHAEVYLCQSQGGLTVSVRHDGRQALLCGGGKGHYNSEVVDALYSGGTAEYLVLPNAVNYSAYREVITRRFSPRTVITTAQTAESLGISGAEPARDHSETVCPLDDSVSDTVIAEGGVLYQYLTIGDVALLFVPHGGDIRDLPAKYRGADIVIMDFVADHAELLHCDLLVYTGQQNKRYEKHREILAQISRRVTLLYHDSCYLTIE